jgi:hypothetical protein
MCLNKGSTDGFQKVFLAYFIVMVQAVFTFGKTFLPISPAESVSCRAKSIALYFSWFQCPHQAITILQLLYIYRIIATNDLVRNGIFPRNI